MEEVKNSTLKSWDEIYAGLKAPMSADAYSTDKSRGFALTSIKAQYVVERLNEVVGIGNWRHTGKYEVPGGESGKEVLFLGSLIIYTSQGANEQFAVGSSTIGGKKSLGDSYKGSKTDSLSKCGSLYGLGNDVFKGLVAPPGAKSSNRSMKVAGSSVEDF